MSRESELTIIRRELAANHAEITLMRSEVASMRAEVASLRSEIAKLRKSAQEENKQQLILSPQQNSAIVRKVTEAIDKKIKTEIEPKLEKLSYIVALTMDTGEDELYRYRQGIANPDVLMIEGGKQKTRLGEGVRTMWSYEGDD